MKGKSLLFLLAFVFFFCVCIQAQDEAEPKKSGFDKSKLFFGGNFGMSFGDVTFINVSPQVGYQFNPFFAAGGGINFISTGYTYRDNNGDKYYKYSYGYAGLNLFGRVYPLPFLFAQIQPEYNYSWGKTKYYNGQPDQKLDNAFVPVLLIGAGAAIPAGRGRMMAMLQYDLIGDERSPYGRSPFFTIGYNF